MRGSLVVLVVALGGAAFADSKTKDLAQGYEKESTACRTRADGVTKVTTGTQALVDDGQKQYEADLGSLRGGLAKVEEYCTELTATLAVLNADPAATYKSLEHVLDDHDNKIRKLRQSSKKALEELAPVIGRMIPAINARVGAAAPVTKKAPLKFPSGRAVDAPVFAGTYAVSGNATTDTVTYTEGKASATVSVRVVANATCEQERKAIKSATELTTDAMKPLALAWYVSYAKDTRRIRVACRGAKLGALVATIDEPTAAKWPELEPVVVAMIAARNDTK